MLLLLSRVVVYVLVVDRGEFLVIVVIFGYVDKITVLLRADIGIIIELRQIVLVPEFLVVDIV